MTVCSHVRLTDMSIFRHVVYCCTAALILLSVINTLCSADPAFNGFLEGFWPAAHELGVSRATFDAATRGLEPDLTLPDLVMPGRPDRQPAQAEFV